MCFLFALPCVYVDKRSAAENINWFLLAFNEIKETDFLCLLIDI